MGNGKEMVELGQCFGHGKDRGFVRTMANGVRTIEDDRYAKNHNGHTFLWKLWWKLLVYGNFFPKHKTLFKS